MTTAEQTAPAEQETEDSARALFRGPFKTIAAALVAAQLNAKAVAKDAKNKFHDYKYASAEALIEEARAALNSAGLATIMEHWEILPPLPGGGPPPSNNRNDANDIHREFQRVKITFKTVHADSDQTLSGTVEYHIVPEKGRPDDKATATALTYAEGYYLRGLLCLPRVDSETDVDQRNDRGFDPSQRRNQDRQRGQQRQGNQRPNGQQGRQQQSRPAGNQSQNGQQRPPQQSGQANGSGKPPAQQAGQPNGQTNGNAPAKAPPANSQAPNEPSAVKQAATPQGSDRYRWWAGKIVGAPDVNQLTGMAAAIGKDTKLDDAEKKLLTDMAQNEARRRDQAQERAGDPPFGNKDEAAQA